MKAEISRNDTSDPRKKSRVRQGVAMKAGAGKKRKATKSIDAAEWLAARDAASIMHTGLGRVTALAEAAATAMIEGHGRHGRRELEAFVHWTALAAREALAEADALVDALIRRERRRR